jgi:hypothetical protein
MDYLITTALEGYPVGWYAPTYKMLSDNWATFKIALQPVTSKISEQENQIKLITGGVLDMWSLENPDSSRGRKYKRVAINEAAAIPKLQYAWNNVIRATLMDYKGEAMFGSTPRGRNFFWEIYQRGNSTDTEWAHWNYPTRANPTIDPDEIEAARMELPDLVFRQEYLGEFVDFEGSVFRRIQEAATSDPITEPIPGHNYIAGVDVASSIDYTVVAIYDVASKELVYLDRFNRVDYNLLEDRLENVYNKFHLQTMTVEANSIGQPVIDHLRGRGMNIIPFVTTNATKQAIITGLQSAFEHGEIHIINDPVLIGELLSFESKRNASGSFSYSAPEGMHDDTVMAAAIGWEAISQPQAKDLIGWA